MADMIRCSIWQSKYLGKCKDGNGTDTRNLVNLQLELKLLRILGGKKCAEPISDD